MSADDIIELQRRLERYHKTSCLGPWTHSVLTVFRDQPGEAARMLAEKTGFERDWLNRTFGSSRTSVSTISLKTGYKISPRGSALMKAIGLDG